jgi:hypothetical protein
MILKVNGMYKTTTGYLIPLSHFNDSAVQKYAVVKLLDDQTNGAGVVGFKTRTTTYTLKDFRQALSLDGKERIRII